MYNREEGKYVPDPMLYIGRGIHPIQLRAKDRKHSGKGGSRGLWAADRGMVVVDEMKQDSPRERKRAGRRKKQPGRREEERQRGMDSEQERANEGGGQR